MEIVLARIVIVFTIKVSVTLFIIGWIKEPELTLWFTLYMLVIVGFFAAAWAASVLSHYYRLGGG